MSGSMTRVIRGSVVAGVAVASLVAGGVAPASAGVDLGIVAGVTSAPIDPDGDVAGAATDLVITLDASLDPMVPGRTLLAGKTVRITLPDDFVNLGGPVLNPGPPPAACPPPAGTCSTGVLLQGWPQHAIPPSPLNYTVGVEGTNTIVYTATRDLVPAVPAEPGLKQMHLVLRNFVNPGPGRYEFLVEAETGQGGALETGVAVVHVRPKPRASINVTSVFNAGTPNTIYQQAAPGATVPLNYDFLLWDRKSDPAVGVEIRPVNDNHAVLVQGRRVVGQIKIEAPRGASGQQVSSLGPSTPIVGPVLGLDTARLTAQFTAGDEPGLYTTTFTMNGGPSVQTFVSVS